MILTAVVAVRSSESVARQLEAQIHAGALVRGQRLPSERELSQRFGVSRGIVREAIKLLEGTGTLQSRHGSGVYLTGDASPSISRALTLSVTPDDAALNDLFTFREELEVVAARFAATHRAEEDATALRDALAANVRAIAAEDWDAFGETDAALHVAVAAAARNSYLATVIAATRQMHRDVTRLFTRHAGAMPTARAQHERIVAAILARDSEGAAAAMREHVRYTAVAVRAALNARRAATVAAIGADDLSLVEPVQEGNVPMQTHTHEVAG